MATLQCQEDEVNVLQSIYGNDFEDLRKLDSSKIGCPPELRITLRPQQSMTAKAAHACVDMIVKCPLLYPDKTPDIKIENAKGLSDSQVAALKHQLEHLANDHQGEVMIYELCQYVENFLHANNKPPTVSFYEQMLLNQKSKEERKAKEHQRLQELQHKMEQQEALEIEEELERNITNARKQQKQTRGLSECESVIETTAAVSRREKARSISPTSDLKSAVDERRKSIGSAGQIECHCHDFAELMSFNTKKCECYKGRCLGHNSKGRSSYIGMLKDTGRLVVVTEWNVQWDANSEKREDELTKHITKQMVLASQELSLLSNLQHQNLVRYLDLSYYGERGRMTFYVLTQYVEGITLKSMLQHKLPMPLEQIYWVTGQLVDALIFLHDRDIVHKDLTPACVFLDRNQCIHLSRFSLHKRLSDLMQEMVSHSANTETQVNVSLRGKKGDVYKLGWIIQCLATGEMRPEPRVPHKLGKSPLDDFILRCVDDEKQRFTVKQLREHPFLKNFIATPLDRPRDQIIALRAAKDIEQQDESADAIVPFVPSASTGSRLKTEFEILASIGKGGFGDVIKVRNKLDDQLYAIKRILLSAEKKHVTKKITREVKLLSRLNHEFVVRYYNSWIETTEENVNAEWSTTQSSVTTSNKVQGLSDMRTPADTKESSNSIGLYDEIEKQAPPEVDQSVEWSVSTQSKVVESSSSDFSDDEDNLFGTSVLTEDSVMFERKEDENVSEEQSTEKSLADSVSNTKQVFKIQFLYIQMEFCEKKTLRDYIDNGLLYKEVPRSWRLLREITEGLVHMHSQGMIHRDLKPTNIFLTSDDHVKIGDFGLATFDTQPMETKESTSEQVSSYSKSDGDGDGDVHTGQVGTALYASPEVLGIIQRTHYNQKVDMYSLGVMFFEMCYRPFKTGMERVLVLTNIRKSAPEFPDDFDEDLKLVKQRHIISWLLNHDPDKRPTSKELVQSDYMPPAQVEEEELKEILRSTLGDRKSTSFYRVLQTLFSLPSLSSHYDVAYDRELYKNKFSEDILLAQMHSMDVIEKILLKHGAVKLASQLLLPKTDVVKPGEGCVQLMDRTGTIITLPYDPQVLFARYIARRGVGQMKRYSFDKVYRENRLMSAFGLHPREITACSFDIVTPADTVDSADTDDILEASKLMPETEVLMAVFEIIKEFPVLVARNYFIRFNHTRLLKAILLHCGITDHHNEVIAILNDAKGEVDRARTRTRLCGLTLSETVVDSLCKFLSLDDNFNAMSSQLRMITKVDGVAGRLAKRALREIEAVVNNLKALGINVPTYLTLSLAHNLNHYAGILFQVAARVTSGNKVNSEVLAAGGRYDRLVSSFTKAGLPACPGAVGINIALDRVTAAAQAYPPVCNVLVSTLGNSSLSRDKLNIALSIMKDLWSAGIRAQILFESDQTLEELQDYCTGKNIGHLIILKELDTGSVKVRSFEKGTVVEKKISINYVVEYLQQKMSAESPDSPMMQSHKVQSTSVEPPSMPVISPSTSNINVTFLLQEDGQKLAKNAKRQYESQIQSGISNTVNLLSARVKLEVIAVDLEAAVIKTIAASLELNDEQMFQRSCATVVEKHPRHRKYLERIFDAIGSLRFQNKCPVQILFSLKENTCKVLL